MADNSTLSDGARVLVVKMSSLGDLFHALPAVHNLRGGLGATVDWVVQSEYADLVRCFNDVDRVIEFPRRRFPLHARRFMKDLRATEYDYVVDMQGLLKSGLVARWARGKRKIGPSFHREGARVLYTDVAGKRNKERHAIEECLDIVRYLGLTVISPEFPVTFPSVSVDLPPPPRVALLPVSRWKSKNWSLESFAAVAGMLQDHAGVSVVLLGGQNDFGSCMALEKLIKGPVHNMAGRTSLVEMASLLTDMDLLITSDSGPMHIAAAIGVPVLALFGPTDTRRTGPYGSRSTVVTAPVVCRPCFDKSCKVGHEKCMQDITPQAVSEAALKMLGV